MERLPPPNHHELPSPPGEKPHGQLASLQLPVTAASPTQSAWCSVSNLIAVALTPEPGSDTIKILMMEPSNPEDCTSLELPVTDPGDYVSQLEWSWPGQRRALLCATASGRVVVWTQPSQQGQDDSVFPRCVDDWHGQLLLDVSSNASAAAAVGSSSNSLGCGGGSGDFEQDARRSSGVAPHGISLTTGIKQEPLGYSSHDVGVAGGSTTGMQQQQQQHGTLQPPAFACVCWLRQPQGGRSWITSVLASRRLPDSSSPSSSCSGVVPPNNAAAADGGGGGGDGAEGSFGAAGRPASQENFDTLFCCEQAAVPGVPHWARPHQLTAAVLTRSGSLTLLWTSASKLPNTLSWHRSKTPIALEPAAASAAAAALAENAAAAATAVQQQQQVVMPYASIAASYDGTLAIAAVCHPDSDGGGCSSLDGGTAGNHHSRVRVYGMRGNPTLHGQLVAPTAAAVVAASTAQSGAAGSGSRRETPLPTVELQAELDVPPGLEVRQCRMQISASGSKRMYVLAAAAADEGSIVKQEPSLMTHTSLPSPSQQPSQEAAIVLSYVSTGTTMGPGADAAASSLSAWRLEHRSPLLPASIHSCMASNGSPLPPALVPPLSSLPVPLSLTLSCDGSKLAVAAGSSAYCLNTESLALLQKQQLAHGGFGTPGDASNGMATHLPSSQMTHGSSLQPPFGPAAVASTVCLSANSCCMCFVAKVVGREGNPPPRPRERLKQCGVDGGGGAGDVDMYDSEAAIETPAAAALVTNGAAVTAGEGDGSFTDDGDGGDEAVLLGIYTVPEVVAERCGGAGDDASGCGTAAAGDSGSRCSSGVVDVVACNLDTMRLAWGLLHKQSLWDISERLRCRWLAGQQAHVARCLDQLDGLFYGHEEISVRGMLASGVTRAKLEVLRRIPHPQAALVASDLLAYARTVQYSQALSLLYSHQSEALSHPETRALAAHMVWFVLEVMTLVVAGIKLWAEEQAAAAAATAGAPGGAAAAAAGDVQVKQEPSAGSDASGAAGGGAGGGTGAGDGGGGGAMLPLIRLYPDYQLHKQIHLVLLGSSLSNAAVSGKTGGDGRGALGLHPAMQELLGSEAAVRVRALVHTSLQLQHRAPKLLNGHLQALLQQQQQNGAGGGAAAAAGTQVTAAEVAEAAKSGDLPRSLMHRSLGSLFSGPFQVHCVRCKGLVTAASIAQTFRQDDMSRFLALLPATREAITERYRALGLQQQLMDRRGAPQAAARVLWRSFRSPAPSPDLHAPLLPPPPGADPQQQRQRWRRQRGAALALASSDPLWSHAQGVLVDCLSGAPLPPGSSWSLEGSGAAGAVTAHMGPGVGAAGSRRNLPPLLAAVQRAWVCCAAPAELGAPWKRARLGLEQDAEY